MSAPKAHTLSDGKNIWAVKDLWRAAEGLTPKVVSVAKLVELNNDRHSWGKIDQKEMVQHVKRVMNADMSYPLILSPDGWIADGLHRLTRAMLEGHETISVVRLNEMPEPLKTETNP